MYQQLPQMTLPPRPSEQQAGGSESAPHVKPEAVADSEVTFDGVSLPGPPEKVDTSWAEVFNAAGVTSETDQLDITQYIYKGVVHTKKGRTWNTKTLQLTLAVNGEHGECKHGKYFILKLVYQANKRRDCGYAVVLNFLDDGNVDKGMRIIRADTAKSSSL